MANRLVVSAERLQGGGVALPSVWSARAPRSLYGDVAVVVFLLTQVLDGTLTYLGVLRFGIASEANPILVAVMETFGHGPGLLGAKTVAAVLGMGLHLARVHLAVALLAGFYVTVAILPWTALLFYP